MATDGIRLEGCRATPLASYLKALGILRLVSSPSNHTSGRAADDKARGGWENGCFHLATRLEPDALLRFFLDDYAPSAIIAPWNGGSGFYPKDNKEGIKPLTETAAPRFGAIAAGIAVAADEVRRKGWTASPKDAAKADLIAALRGRLPDSALPWLDAAVALSSGRLSFPQLLGTGGNDGRLDFTNTFMRRLVAGDGLFDAATGAPAPRGERLLRAALGAAPAQGLSSYPTGQFAPGAAGGPNATSAGYDGTPHTNPWDFVLALEGAVLFAGGATRRHQGAPETGASFPFTVRTTAAGWGGLVDVDADRENVRAEFWAPLWRRPAGSDELARLLKEGRATLGRRTARDGLDFARAAATLGTSRGITAFQRYGFAKRQGNMYLAAPLGVRTAASQVPEGAELIDDFDPGGWLQIVRRLAQDKNAPARARQLMKRFQDSLFALTETQAASATVQHALENLGEIAGWLSTSPAARAASRPPPLLQRAWLRRGDDGSAEFRAAAALASLGWAPVPPRRSGTEAADPMTTRNMTVPMASCLAPVDPATVARRFREWDRDGGRSGAAWGAGGLVANLVALLERSSLGSTVDPLVAAAPTWRDTVTRFLADDFDDRRCARLLGGLVWVRPTPLRQPESAETAAPPFAYAALKLLFAPGAVVDAFAPVTDERVRRIPVPSGLVARLRGGDVDGAVRSALARARASGVASPFARGGRAHTTAFGAGMDGRRLAAALLIPIHDDHLCTLLERAYIQQKEKNDVA